MNVICVYYSNKFTRVFLKNEVSVLEKIFGLIASLLNEFPERNDTTRIFFLMHESILFFCS